MALPEAADLDQNSVFKKGYIHPVSEGQELIIEPRSDKRDLLATKVNSDIFTEKERPSYCEELQKI